MNSILQDLKNIITGEISNQSSDLAEVSQDFGNIIQKNHKLLFVPKTPVILPQQLNMLPNKV